MLMKSLRGEGNEVAVGDLIVHDAKPSTSVSATSYHSAKPLPLSPGVWAAAEEDSCLVKPHGSYRLLSTASATPRPLATPRLLSHSFAAQEHQRQLQRHVTVGWEEGAEILFDCLSNTHPDRDRKWITTKQMYASQNAHDIAHSGNFEIITGEKKEMKRKIKTKKKNLNTQRTE